MKKLFTPLLAATMALSLVACSTPQQKDKDVASADKQDHETTVAAEDDTSTKAGDETTAAAANSTAEGVVTVYSPHDADPLAAGVAAFEKAYPNIKVNVVAAGTGELLQRVVAESANPIADVLWGGGADSLAAYKDYFESYTCANDANIDAKFKDVDHLWTGESPLPMVFIYNKTLIDEADVPKTWEDLSNENLKGKIAYASPAKSGSAYTQLCTMLFSQADTDKGWELVEKFYNNLDGKVQESSGNCHKLVASGEYSVGVTIEKSAVKYDDNPDIAFVYPEKNSAVPDGVALIKSAPNADNAKLFIDFVTGEACQTEQNKDWARRPVLNTVEPVGLEPLSALDIADYDFNYAANNKESVIEKWQEIIIG